MTLLMVLPNLAKRISSLSVVIYGGYIPTGLAVSLSGMFWWVVHVLFGKFVSILTVCLASILSHYTIASHNILSFGNGFKVIWVDAGSVST